MATHSSILAWEIPWTEEPSVLYSLWDHKGVGPDLVTKQKHLLLFYFSINLGFKILERYDTF